MNFRTLSWPTGRSWIQRVSLGVAVAACSAGLLAAGTLPANAAAPAAAGGIGEPADYICGYKLAKTFLQMCSHREHTFKEVKVARCMLGHGPFLGLTGPGKFVYWAGRCQDTEWEKW